MLWKNSMTKGSYLILHYGKPYLAYAIEAIYPQVDKIAIAYTDRPSQSFGTTLQCPDTRQELLDLIEPWRDKIEWIDGNWTHEYEHCDAARAAISNCDWQVRLDADEIFPEGAVDHYIAQAEKQEFQNWRMPFYHFWRSFGKVCRDSSFPQRLERKEGNGSGWLDDEQENYRVAHMGYAMPTEYIIYKMAVQGHHNEWRPDWYEGKWLPNAQQDVHPVIYIPPFWNTEDFDKLKLPKVLHKHPYFKLDIIE